MQNMCCCMCTEVADLLREHGGIYIRKLVQKLQHKKVLRDDPNFYNDNLCTRHDL